VMPYFLRLMFAIKVFVLVINFLSYKVTDIPLFFQMNGEPFSEGGSQ